MAYNNLTLSDVIERFELNVSGMPLCENLPVAAPSDFRNQYQITPVKRILEILNMDGE
jgi:hypothetical protein